MAIATAFFAFLLILPAVYAVDYTVGDTNGWTQGIDYTTWTAGKTFNTGDTLVFNYGGSHTVDVVNKGDYDSCNTGNTLESHSDGSTKITLSKAGPMYFTCSAFGHCSGGMKLAVTVSAASTTPSNGTPTTPSTTTPSPTTPSTETPSSTTPSGTTPSRNTDNQAGTNGASSNLYNMNYMFGACLVLAPLLVLMG
ncbi:Early nodulin-like protein [Thalictrum thalictroides]|uniref:Early nodulin-like protein n=1 Tax=Thalictrum thalictroides TaxID=46969 RepID=A0A7J6VYD5_THATH|nr:Early nodulin-like protein [Thalictrum thalictroides]